MAEDAMEVAMEVDEASTSHKADSSSEGQREDVWYFPTAAHRWSLVEKYRPTSLADVAAHTDIIDTRENWLLHLLLYAPPGTHKITCPAVLNESKLYFPALHSSLLSTI
ncbi:unnamed protein product [Sphagnum tenellum]